MNCEIRMKLLDRESSHAWLTARGYPPREHVTDWTHAFGLPKESGRLLALARTVAGFFTEGDRLLGATEIGVFTDSGEAFVFERFLASSSLTIDLFQAVDEDHIEDRYVLFQPGEDRYMAGAVGLCLLYVYGGFLARGDGSLMIRWSHDEFIFAVSADQPTYDAVTLELRRLGSGPLAIHTMGEAPPPKRNSPDAPGSEGSGQERGASHL